MAKNHNQRQRKKLHLGEFKELGFAFKATLVPGCSKEQEERIADLLIEFVESRNLVMGGWVDGGFICTPNRGCVTEDDRKATQEWLRSQREIASSEVSDLFDAWHEASPF